MIGLCSVTFREKPAEEVIRIAAEAHLECIEWESKNHVKPGEITEARRVSRLTREAGLTVSSYGTYYQLGSEEDFEHIIDTALALETRMIRVWAGEKSSAEADAQWFDTVVEETRRLADLTAKSQLSLSFEYHSGTLTDTPDSAQHLIEKIDKPNVFLYWQPAESLTVEEQLASLKNLSPYISNVHVFNWKDYKHRYELSEGKKDWLNYITLIEDKSAMTHHYLLEFVKDDDSDQLKKDAQVILSLLG